MSNSHAKQSQPQQVQPEPAKTQSKLDMSDLTHDEKIRGHALAQACRYYTDTIVKDGVMYQAMMASGKVLKPATYTSLIEVAFAFEQYLTGKLTDRIAGDWENEAALDKDEQIGGGGTTK